MKLRDTDSWLPVALVAAAMLIAIPACLPKDSDGGDERSGGSGYWDSGWDSYSDDNEFDDDSDGDAATDVQDIDIDLSWNMTRDIHSTWNFTADCR
jgi:hypothetical protein